MAEAARGHLAIAHLDDEFGLQRDPLGGSVGRPTAGAAGPVAREAFASRRVDLDWLDGELRDLAVTFGATSGRRGGSHGAPINVLFLCNSNSGRSQIGGCRHMPEDLLELAPCVGGSQAMIGCRCAREQRLDIPMLSQL